MSVNNYTKKKTFTVNLKKIEQKILNVQKNIYNASKNCDINKVHRIQNHFLEHSDYKFLFIKLIVKQMLKKKFFIDDYDWKIIVYLYICINIKKKFSITIYFVKEKVQQYIFFLLLQPEWKARLENILCLKHSRIQSKKNKIESIFKNFCRIHKSINQAHIDININIKFINNKYLISKINSVKYIATKLNLWLNSQNLFSHNYEKIKIKSIHCYQHENYLYKLLQSILHTGIEWHMYINLKKQKIYEKFIVLSENKLFFINHTGLSRLNIYIAMFIKKLSININLIKYSSQKIFDQRINLTYTELLIKLDGNIKVNLNNNFFTLLISNIRSVLYHKNKLGQWRLNTYLSSNQAKLAIKKILLDWYKSYYYILGYTQIFKINVIVNKMFYIWQTKK